ncbi:MAG TPA: glycoside hydrolase family 30 beta sandwich domain-containing protein [Mycobacteriales bacterium]
MRQRRFFVVVGAVALTAAVVPPAAASADPGGAAPTARVWVTSPDRAELMHDRGTVAFGTQRSGELTITVDPSRTYQTMDGFGASITDSSAAVLYRLDPAARERAMRSLFDPARGIGVSALRQPIGSSDFTDEPHYTYDDMPAGQTDFALAHFSIAHDQAQILPLLRRARALNPRVTVIATPWSPPAWMKTTDSLIGGRLKDDPRVYAAYARYFVKFVQAYRAAGVPVDYLTVQNEPQNRTPNAYPGMDLPVPQEVKLIEAVGPALRAAGLRTRILAYDHNWTTHPGDIASTPPGEDPETDYPYEVLASPAAKWVAGTAYHCYSGDPSAQTALHDAYPDKGIWFTECSGSHGPDDPPAKFFRDTLTFHARNITIGTTRNWAKTAITWNIALDSSGGPHNGGCDTCTGLLTLEADGTVSTNAEYYTIGHLSKFVQPGAVRIASTSFGTTGWNGQIMDVAFRNPDGSTALVVHNENDDPRTFAVAVGGRSFDYTLPGGALATFTWPRSRQLDDGYDLVPLNGATVTATPTGETPQGAVDDDASTRWSTDTAQEPGQQLQVDLGRREAFRRVVLDTGASTGDYARSWTLQASNDAAGWRTLASGTGTGQLTAIDVPRTHARYLRVVSTGSSGSWWSVADLRLYD